MKIAIDARLYGLHHRGLGRYLIELVKGLIATGTKHQYFLLIDPKAQSSLPSLPKHFITVAAPYRVYSLAEQTKLPRMINRLQPDLVHFTHFSAPYFCPAPFVVTIHDLILHHAPTERATHLPSALYWSKIAAYHLLLKRLVKKARHVITVSQTVATDLKKCYPQAVGKTSTIYQGVSPLPPGQALGPSPPYLLAVGATYPHKNIERAVAAVAMVRQQYPKLELWLAGRIDFFADKLKSWLRQQGYLTWVKFLGEVSDADLAALYRGSQAYLLPSLEEGFGLGALEALACGTVVVAADIPALREVLGPEGALFVEPTNTLALAAAISKIMGDDFRSDLKRAAQPILARYSWSDTVQQTLSVYEQAY